MNNFDDSCAGLVLEVGLEAAVPCRYVFEALESEVDVAGDSLPSDIDPLGFEAGEGVKQDFQHDHIEFPQQLVF